MSAADYNWFGYMQVTKQKEINRRILTIKLKMGAEFNQRHTKSN